MKRETFFVRLLGTTLTAGLLGLLSADAAPPGKGGGGSEPPSATVIHLSSAHGYVRDMTETVNNAVAVVGYTYKAEQTFPIPKFWVVKASGSVSETILKPLVAGDLTIPDSVNNYGMIVGVGGDPDDVTTARALWWPSASSDPIELPTPKGAFSRATGIDDNGLIVGLVLSTDRAIPGFGMVAWKVDIVDGQPVVQDAKVFDLALHGHVHISSSSGYVASTFYTENEELRAFRMQLGWDGEQIYEVPSSRTQLFNVYSTALAVNDIGTVVGAAGDDRRAFAVTADGKLLTLPTLPGGKYRGTTYEWINVAAVAINDANAVITESRRTANLEPLYTDALVIPGGSAHDLLGFSASWVPFSTQAINNAGLIAGGSLDANGVEVPSIMILPQ